MGDERKEKGGGTVELRWKGCRKNAKEVPLINLNIEKYKCIFIKS